jgi:hypothetical protein
LTSLNWQYDLLDDQAYQEQLKAWHKVSYSDLRDNFTAIPSEILVVPALLFQVLAQALLIHSPNDEMVSGLLLIPDMTYHDLGAEYSDTGADILVLLGKGRVTTSTVQAGLLRASFLKSIGKVAEAWHALGATIRDAQEIGLHTGRNRYRQHLSDTEGGMQGSSASGNKLWIILHIWDAHMAVVLGRPMATHLQLDTLTRTVGDDEGQGALLSHWQTEDTPPRPFDIIMAGYTVAYRYFQDIYDLEHHNTESQAEFTVERIHATIVSNSQLLPSWCRLENASTKFDAVRGCQWLPAAREGLYSLIHLVLLTLHRPYVFSKSSSRVEALKAGVSILHAQERLFQQSEPYQQNLFTPVYHSFDAIVLIATICLLYPGENRDRRTECIEAVGEGVQRLEISGRSNRMARSAHGVASSLYLRLMRLSGISEPKKAAEAASKTFGSSEAVFPESHWELSNSFFPDLASEAVPPPRPTHDLFYNHLSSAQTPSFGTIDQLPVDSFLGNVTENWNFEGTFPDESFWGFLNRLDSGM